MKQNIKYVSIWMYKQLEEENKNLKEELKQLEERYDRNAELYKRLLEENKKLKSDLEECECSMHFENDEVWYRKRECKKLKETIKDHQLYEEKLEHRIIEFEELLHWE